MGRCYEFGVAVVEGCEHAMVVAPAGGACECATCGARCLGKFGGCAEVVSHPGAAPATAPRWAVERTAPPATHASEPVAASPPFRSDEPFDAGSALPERMAPEAAILPEVAPAPMDIPQALLVAVQSELDAVRSLLHALLDRAAPASREEMLDAVERIRNELNGRDRELKDAFDAVVDHYGRLADTVDAIGARLELMEQRTAGRPSPLKMFRRD